MGVPCLPYCSRPSIDALGVFLRACCAVHVDDGQLTPVHGRWQNREFAVAVELPLEPAGSLADPWVAALFQDPAQADQVEWIRFGPVILRML
jgi:hypothetical protein